MRAHLLRRIAFGATLVVLLHVPTISVSAGSTTPPTLPPTTESNEPTTPTTDVTVDSSPTETFTIVGANPDLDSGEVALIAVVGLVAVLGLAAWWMARRDDPDDRPAPPTTQDPTGSELL